MGHVGEVGGQDLWSALEYRFKSKLDLNLDLN